MPKGISPRLNICHMYPDLLNLYGDRGNIIAFRMRCLWRDIQVEVHQVNIGDRVDFSRMDFIFFGGGSDREQKLMTDDLMDRAGGLREAIEGGTPVLAICGGYQLLGKYYKTIAGEILPGLDILDLHTEGGEKRLIGNAVVEVELDGVRQSIAGFENHSGRTFLGKLQPLGKVLSGYGNNGQDKMEGARYKNVLCSYLHGPLLPKNPVITDYLINCAVRRRHDGISLAPIDDTLENSACRVMIKRLQGV